MPKKLCQPGEYGLCDTCSQPVTIVIQECGQRVSQTAVDRGPALVKWTCEKCVELKWGSRPTWNPDKVTQSVLNGTWQPTQKNPDLEKIKGKTILIKQQLEYVREQMKFLIFDLEATRRERDYWRILAQTGIAPGGPAPDEPPLDDTGIDI